MNNYNKIVRKYTNNLYQGDLIENSTINQTIVFNNMFNARFLS